MISSATLPVSVVMRALLSVLVLFAASACVDPGAGAPEQATQVLRSPVTTADASRPATPAPAATGGGIEMREYAVGRGQGPHDVAPAPDGGVWYTAQTSGELGYLDPKTGATRAVKLGQGSAPHGVIVGPDGAPWVTDGGLNAIVRVDPITSEVRRFALPGPNANLNTAVFDTRGVLWFTGQSGYFGYLDPDDGSVHVSAAPGGAGPYGITATPAGVVYYASLAGSHIARIDVSELGPRARPIAPPTAEQGSRRVWSDSNGDLWVSEWNAGQVARYSPTSDTWKEWKLPGARPMAYAVYVDDRDVVWLSDFGANAIVRFDPRTETFSAFPFVQPNANVRQLLGRPGEVWGAMSGQDKLVVVRTR